MRDIPKKNYFALAVLVLITILLALSLANLYKNREKLTSDFYRYSNKITQEEFDEYVLERTDLIIYISDKYDLLNKSFEDDLKDKINELNLKDKLVFMDKSELKGSFLKKLRDVYDIDINVKKLPMIVVIVDKKPLKKVFVDSKSKADSIIQYEVFE